MDLVSNWAGIGLAVFSFIGATLITYGKMSEKIVFRSICEKKRGECQTKICKKLDEIQKIMKEGEQKRELSKDKNQQEFQHIARLIGQLEGKIKNNNV